MVEKHRGIAQLVEQRSPKPRAEGSSPSAPAKINGVPVGTPFIFYMEKGSNPERVRCVNKTVR